MNTRMQLLIVSIIIIINLSTTSAKPLENKKGEDFLGNLQLLARKDGLNEHAQREGNLDEIR